MSLKPGGCVEVFGTFYPLLVSLSPRHATSPMPNPVPSAVFPPEPEHALNSFLALHSPVWSTRTF